MAKLQYNGNQYTITIPEDLIRRMGWEKGCELFLSKGRNEEFLYVEKMIEKLKEVG